MATTEGSCSFASASPLQRDYTAAVGSLFPSCSHNQAPGFLIDWLLLPRETGGIVHSQGHVASSLFGASPHLATSIGTLEMVTPDLVAHLIDVRKR
jgi:hypothetical protein